jgi:hypothetical protein
MTVNLSDNNELLAKTHEIMVFINDKLNIKNDINASNMIVITTVYASYLSTLSPESAMKYNEKIKTVLEMSIKEKEKC